MVVNFEKRSADEGGKNPAKNSTTLFVHTLLYVLPNKEEEGLPNPCLLESDDGDIDVVPIHHSSIFQISSLRVHIPDDLTSPDKKKSVLKSIKVPTKAF